MSHPFAYAELHTPNQGKAKDFYTGLFGWKAKETPTKMGPYVEVEPGEGFPGGILTAMPGAAPAWVVYMKVSDVAASTRKAKELGAQALAEDEEVPDVGRFSILKDPTGATFGLWQPLVGK